MRHEPGDAATQTRPPQKAPSCPAHCGLPGRTVSPWLCTLLQRASSRRGTSDGPGSPHGGLGRTGPLFLHLVLAVAILLAGIVGCSAPRKGQPTPVASLTPLASPTPRTTSDEGEAPAGKGDAQPNFLSTSGSKIVDAEGKEVRLAGINWFGMETGTFSPHGLWARNWEDMLDQVAELGYNVIRLPYSNQLLDENAKPLEGIDFQLNPDLRGLNGVQILDKIVAGAGERGLKIVLDRHRPGTEVQSKLWYTEEVSEEQWIADWRFLAKRYKGNDTVIGADLHNEPAGDATWGSGDPKTDWRLAAERCGNAILDVNPDWLIVVEGIEKYDKDWYWMGSSLQGVAEYPVRLKVPNKLVYSAHDYGPGVFNQGWFNERDFPRNMPQIWDTHWGYIVKQGIAPVLLGEFGGRSVSSSDKEGIWQRALVGYLKENGISYTYWALNPNSGDTGGILDDDWKTVHEEKQKLLASDQAPRLAINSPDKINIDLKPVARKTPLPATPLRVFSKGGNPEEPTGEAVLDLRIDNLTPFRAPLEQMELRYWLDADLDEAQGGGAAAYALSLDWASVSDVNLELVPDTSRNQTHYVKITFGRHAGMMPREGKLEIKVRLKRLDRKPIQQDNDYSYAKTQTHELNDRVAIFLWGERVWGVEP